MRKLVIFLLFLVFTVAAIGFVSFSTFKMATNFAIDTDGSYKTAVAAADSVVVINNPVAGISALSNYAQIVIIQAGEDAGSIYIVSSTNALTQAEGVLCNATMISGAAVFIWLFMLLLIIFLPRRRSKKSVRRIAEDVVDDEMDSRPAPRRSYDQKKSKRSRDYDEYYDE